MNDQQPPWARSEYQPSQPGQPQPQPGQPQWQPPQPGGQTQPTQPGPQQPWGQPWQPQPGQAPPWGQAGQPGGPQYQQPYPGGMPGGGRARKKRRVFLWVFLAIQVIFIIWIIAGLATKTGPSQADLASACYHHNWWPLFSSQADCVTHYGGALNTAGNVGKGLGVALVILFWCVVDFLVGGGYAIYRLASRRR